MSTPTSQLAATNLNFTNASQTTGTIAFNNSDEITMDKDVSVAGGLGSTSLNISGSGQAIATSSFSTLGTDSIEVNGSTSGTTTIEAAAVTTDYTMTLPSAQGSSGTYLKNDGSGGLSWASASAGGPVASVQFEDDQASPALITMEAPATVTAHTLTLPSAQGGNRTYLRNNGSGALSWTVSNELSLLWESVVMGTPTSNQPVLNGSLLGSGYQNYEGIRNGVRFTNNTSQNGRIEWNMSSFDFTNRDFEMAVTCYQGGSADGIQFGVGGSSSWSNMAGTTNGGLGFSYNTYVDHNDTNFSIGSSTSTKADYLSNDVENVWFTARMEVRKQGSKRYAIVYHNGNPINGYEVTSWSPSGGYIFVGGRTGLSSGDHYCRSASLKYLD